MHPGAATAPPPAAPPPPTPTPFAFNNASALATTSAEEDDNPDAIGTSPLTVPSIPRLNSTPYSNSPRAAART